LHNILFSNNVIVFLFIETIILILQFIAFFLSIKIVRLWDFKSTSSLQYKLEKRAYLVILIVFFSIIVKIFMLPYFAYSLDKLSTIVPGAMCAAGVISANDYGQYLLILKILILLFMGIWLILNNFDIKAKNYPYFKSKTWLFIAIFIFVCIEYILDILYYTNINTQSLVSCCSTIYGVVQGTGLPFNLDIYKLLILFYLTYTLVVVVNIQKIAYLSMLANSFFAYIAYFCVVYFFGTYIYELPTHKCPFCMLQSDYFYIGYFIWASLFLGLFFGIASFILKLLLKQDQNNLFKYSTLFITIFVSICSFYVLRYYFINGVFL
jgi:hypothetical protein